MYTQARSQGVQRSNCTPPIEKPKIYFCQQGPDRQPTSPHSMDPPSGCKRNLCSMDENRILLRTVALVLLFISFGSESTIVQTAVL